MTSEKAELRSKILASMEHSDAGYVSYADRCIAEKLFGTAEYRASKVIYTYLSVGREVDTRRIILQALNDGKTVTLPVTGTGGIMVPRILRGMDELVPGRYGIPVPPEENGYMDENRIDLILVPGIAFDHGGFRLGRGGGYYDRLLSRTAACSIGLVRSEQLLPNVPREEHDKAVYCIISEKGVLYCR